MTQLCRVGNLKQRAGKIPPLRYSRLWHYHVEALRPPHLLAFYYKQLLAGRGQEAETAINILLEEIRAAIHEGALKPVAVVRFRFPKPVLSTVLLERLLQPMPVVRRQAVLFALDTGLPLDRVIRLRWRHVRQMTLGDRAQAVLASRPHHIHSDLVFWEQLGIHVVPLPGLAANFSRNAYGLTWREFLQLYRMCQPERAEDAEATGARMQVGKPASE